VLAEVGETLEVESGQRQLASEAGRLPASWTAPTYRALRILNIVANDLGVAAYADEQGCSTLTKLDSHA